MSYLSDLGEISYSLKTTLLGDHLSGSVARKKIASSFFKRVYDLEKGK